MSFYPKFESIIFLLLLTPFSALAQEQDDFDWDSYPLDEDETYETVVVGEPVSEEGLSRTRIKNEELERRGSSTVVEAIEHEPAVFAASGKKGERTFRLRGFDQRGVAVYFDGVPFALPYDGTADLGKMPVEMIDGILVLKGPTSIVHGPGGMGGAVLIETRAPSEKLTVETQSEVSDLLESKYSVYLSNDPGFVAYSLGAGGSLSNGYRLSSQFEPTYYEDGGVLDNSDRRMYHVSGKLVFPMPGQNEITVQGFVLDGTFGIPRSTTDNRPFFSRFSMWQASVAQIVHRFKTDNFTFEDAAYISFYHNRLDAFDDETYQTQEGPNAYRSWYRDYGIGGRIRADYSLKGMPAGSTHLRLWLRGEHDAHRSRLDVGESQNTYRRTLFTVVPEVEIPLVRTITAIASGQVDIDIPDTSDAVIDTVEGYQDRNNTTFGPLVSVRWDPMDDVMVRVSAARRNRIPSLSERYSSRLGFSQANPELDPESAWHFGLDVDWRVSSHLDLSVSGFDAEVQDTIQSEYLPEMNGVTQKQNIGRARLAGAEVFATLRPVEQLQFKAGYAYLFARRLDETDEEDRIAQIPAHQAVFGVIFEPSQWLELSSYFRIIGPQAFDDYNILGLGELGTYAVWDARLEISPIPGVTTWLKGMNLLDMNYQTDYGFPDRGFSLWLGLRITSDVW